MVFPRNPKAVDLPPRSEGEAGFFTRPHTSSLLTYNQICKSVHALFTTRATKMPENHKTLADSSVDNTENQLQLPQMRYVAIVEAKYVTAVSIFASEANLKNFVCTEEVTFIQNAHCRHKFKHNLNRKACLWNFFQSSFS